MTKATHRLVEKKKRRRSSRNSEPPVSDDAIPPQVSLTRRSGTSLKHQIFLVLRDQITAGNYPAGASLPSEKSLSQEYKVSRITVRAALAELEASGLVDRRHGIGTFVTDHAKSAPIHATLSDLVAHIADVGRSTKVELREVGFVKAPLHVQTLFKCAPDQLFQRAVRIRSRNGLPIFHIMTMVPESIARRFTRKELSGASLYQLLRSKGFQFKAGTQTISAVLALPSVAQVLNLEVGAPLLQVRRLHFDEFMRPFEYMEYLASPAHFEVQMTLGEQDLPK
jgi:GntR family transcriptional regulator